MSHPASLAITHAAIRRGGTCIVHGGEIVVPLGSTVGLVGLNGAGKSTLMMAIAGALGSSSTAMTLRTTAGPIRAVGYVPQQPRFPEWLTVAEVASLYGVSPDALVAAFPEFQLDALLEQRVPALSGGQRQLVAVALTLRQAVDLVVLDEPLAALDIRRRRQVLERLRERDERQRHVVRMMSSQVAADIAEICDWLVVLRDGHYVFQGARDALSAGPNDLTVGRTRQDTKGEFESRILELLAE